MIDYPFQPVRRDDRHPFGMPRRETIRRFAGNRIISRLGGFLERFPQRVGHFL
jgi:hypothetical protein